MRDCFSGGGVVVEMIGDLMGYKDIRDLEKVWGDDDLKKHYKTARPTYVLWRDDGCNKTVDLIGGGTRKLNTKDTYVYVKGMILQWDTDLEDFMTTTEIPNEIGLDHERVAECFAMHVTANMPVPQ